MKPHITIGISGGIAAYKIPQLVRDLTEFGVGVSCIVTESALEFVTKTTLETLTSNAVTGPSTGYKGSISHLNSKKNSSAFVVAPATANFIAKATHGIADDALSTAFLAYDGPKIIVPAMHDSMWANPATQDNIQILQRRGIMILGPDVGKLSSGDYGPGRMIETRLILLKIQLVLNNTPRLDNYSVLISIGGTQEPIDPVRVITNLSSGNLGLTVANGFALSGAKVVAVSTVPVPPNPHIHSVIYCKTAAQLQQIIQTEWINHDLLVMPAAVSDFRPSESQEQKISRTQGALTLTLSPTEDILANLPRHRKTQRIIGFCLSDSNDLIGVAKEKMHRKNLDAIIANTPHQFGAIHRDFQIITPETIQTYRDRSLSETSSIIIKLAAHLRPPFEHV